MEPKRALIKKNGNQTICFKGFLLRPEIFFRPVGYSMYREDLMAICSRIGSYSWVSGVISPNMKCPKLQVLSIKSSPHVTDEIMSNIASQCPLLRELDISFCYEISHKSLSTIGQHCSNLQILRRNFMNWLDPSQHVRVVPREYLDACPQDGDSEAAAIAKFTPQLLQLELQFSKLTNKGLTLISEGCTNLEYLDLSGCANVTGRGISSASSNLKKLKTMKKPNFYIPRSVFHTERYGHWQLYDERFQTDVFRI
ncbi:F-box protein SKIP1-like isoform X2 [Lycium barbarum]|uniref:F-box protein SKIP1-like isoform X2 n=1 Tax=Lycium barbarum TaxID=112863 RepID=UPI00293E3376|nr:F-box protein SKIP1-like isoform X2 [Lycium barbarum]